MKLIWHGHACFSLISANGTLVIDPYQDGSVPGLTPLRLTGDLVLCSHEHFDHCARETVTLTHQPHSFNVFAIETYHDDKQGTLRGPNRIHIIQVEGMKVVHLGDLGCPLKEDEIETLKNCDVLMIPVGGFYTIDASLAYEIVKQVHPRIVVPMHYRSLSFGYDVLDTVDSFLSHFDHHETYLKEMEITQDTKKQVAVFKLS